MIRRLFRLLLPTGLLLAVVLLVRRTVHLREEGARVVPSPDRWPPIPAPEGAAQASPSMTPAAATIAPLTTAPEAASPAPPTMTPEAATTAAPTMTPEGATTAPTVTPAATAWMAPVDGGCPPTHPIKVKEASGIYHLPGMLYYERTRPDRCYADESAAVADGFTKSKR